LKKARCYIKKYDEHIYCKYKMVENIEENDSVAGS